MVYLLGVRARRHERADRTEDRTVRTSGPSATRTARTTMRNIDGCAGSDGRYWARTSDPQLVELVLSQLS
jgi:hypothetical protein